MLNFFFLNYLEFLFIYLGRIELESTKYHMELNLMEAPNVSLACLLYFFSLLMGLSFPSNYSFYTLCLMEALARSPFFLRVLSFWLFHTSHFPRTPHAFYCLIVIIYFLTDANIKLTNRSKMPEDKRGRTYIVYSTINPFYIKTEYVEFLWSISIKFSATISDWQISSLWIMFSVR